MLCCYRNQAQLGSGLNLTNASNMIEKWNQIDIMAHILWSHCLHNVPLDCGVDFKFRKVAILKDSWGCNYGIVKQLTPVIWNKQRMCTFRSHSPSCNLFWNKKHWTDRHTISVGRDILSPTKRRKGQKQRVWGSAVPQQTKQQCLCVLRLLSQEYPTLTTFFAGEIISRKRPFLTRKWDADEDVDRKHWVSWSIPNLHMCSKAWCFAVT